MALGFHPQEPGPGQPELELKTLNGEDLEASVAT